MTGKQAREARKAAAIARAAALVSGNLPNRTVATNPALRVQTVTYGYGFTGTRRHGNKRSDKGGSGTGGCKSVWNKTAPSYKTPGLTSHDSRYDQTLSGTRNV